MSIPLTQQAHNKVLQFISIGDIAIDATCGNGHDTIFLAKALGDSGKVYAFDIQQAAILKTRKRLEQENIDNATLINDCHSKVSELIPAEDQKQIKVIMFNLGYLPGSDKSLITQTTTTITALEYAIELIAEGGLISIVLYPGHLGGEDEASAVLHWLKNLSTTAYRYEIIDGDSTNKKSPQLIFLYKI